MSSKTPTIQQLKKEADEQGIEYSSRITKNELLKLLDREDEIVERKPKSSKKTVKGSKTGEKKGKNGYLFFCDEHRQTVRDENPDEKLGGISKILGAMWKELSEDEKAPYQEQAKEAKNVSSSSTKKEEKSSKGATTKAPAKKEEKSSTTKSLTKKEEKSASSGSKGATTKAPAKKEGSSKAPPKKTVSNKIAKSKSTKTSKKKPKEESDDELEVLSDYE